MIHLNQLLCHETVRDNVVVNERDCYTQIAGTSSSARSMGEFNQTLGHLQIIGLKREWPKMSHQS